MSAAERSREGAESDVEPLGGVGAQKRMGQSAVRDYAPYTMRHAVRRAWTLRGVGQCGPRISVERDVRILRHPERVELGAHVMLKEGTRICPTNPEASIGIGARTTVGHHTFIFAMHQISVGSDTLIAPFCYLIDNQHGTAPERLIREQPMTAERVTIGDDVWLGTGALIGKGVTVGDGAVVGARSVVLRDVPSGAVVAGVPAELVRYRSGT